MQDVQGKRVTVAGLGRFNGGIAVSKWLVQQGAARVIVSDAAPAEKLAESIELLRGFPIQFRLGSEQSKNEFQDTDLVVASPAFAPSNPFLMTARAAGVPITTEIRLFIERCAAPIIGITGTKGKSTTTAMLGRMLEPQIKTWVGGNIGKSLLDDLPRIEPSHQVVLELSSFMLEYLASAKWSPHIAVITMISADHLDWHKGIDNYVNAKRNILRFQNSGDFSVLNEQCPTSLDFSTDAPAKVVRFGITGRRRFELRLGGEHNQLNAQAAFAAAELLGVTWEQAQSELRDFEGLPHRLQLVFEHKGVRFVNDSIATIPQAAIAALRSFPSKRVIQIVGGSLKKDHPIKEMCAALAERAKAVICIGESGPKIAAELKELGADAHQRHDLAQAIHLAKSIATSGDVVLLSPGYASYDQFVNFEKRGELFMLVSKT